MSGLQRILKQYGRMNVDNVVWVWDYATDKPRLESEMTKAEKEASRVAQFSVSGRYFD